MIAVTELYKTGIKGSPRRIVPRVEITWTDPMIDSSIEASSADINRISYPTQCADLITVTPRKWAHIDGTLKPDGTFYPCPSTVESATNQMGWFGADRCDAGAEWAAESYPLLRVTFDARAVIALLVNGDTAYNEYPVDFTINLYDSGMCNILYTVDVEDNDGIRWFKNIIDEDITACGVMELIVKKWSAPNRIVKINEFYTSITDTYEGDDIVTMNFLEEGEIRGSSLPIGNISSNELDLELQNIKLITQDDDTIVDPFFPSNTDSYLHTFVKKNRRISAYLGLVIDDDNTEWIPLGTFWSGDWDVSELGGSVKTSCRDRMELLRSVEFDAGEVYEAENLYEILDDILLYAATNIPMPDLLWQIDEELKNYTVPYAYFLRKNYMETIRDITEACLARAYFDRHDVLIISASLSDMEPYAITTDDYFQRSQPDKSDEICNRVEVLTRPLELSAQELELYRSDTLISIGAYSGVVVEAKYSDEPVMHANATLEDNGVNVSITAEEYFSWGAKITVYNSGGTASQFTLVVNGQTLDLTGERVMTAEDSASIASNGLQKFTFKNNHLIQSETMAQLIADTVLATYKTPRKDVVIQWRGNMALEIGDLIEVPEYQKNGIDIRGTFYIYKNSLDYDGTLKATTSGRKVS